MEKLIVEFKKITWKPIAIYPNRGEVWDGRAKRWLEMNMPCNADHCGVHPVLPFSLHLEPSECLGHEKFEVLAKRWKDAGASLIGGCCRTSPATIQAVSSVIKSRP
ncbi:hypothetical protein J5N97_007001 [Dioscorea zingiberensis]|uniref:Hcy-binding domain-containing protein n=1 Tax=Dioscorea zingiberensis TaxID=325984 RepID=A0A9D5DD63_9LILI|nr:hypothetical protein J5N97_007001 [Dioscorea zingiberensis]